MQIVNQIISDISQNNRLISVTLSVVIANVREKGFLDSADADQLKEIGIPIISVIKNVLKISIEEANSLIGKHCIKYDDFLILIGIIAQDIAVIKRRKRE